MIELLTHFNVKLYDKNSIEKWELPKGIKEQIGIDEHDFFLLTNSKEGKHGKKHVHFSVYPIKHKNVNLLEVEVPSILPKILHHTLECIKKKGYDIITSTGFCTHENICHFGVFFSNSIEGEKEDLILMVKSMENIDSVNIFTFSCEKQ